MSEEKAKLQAWYVAKANEMMGFYVALKTEMTALKQLVDALEQKVSRIKIGMKK